MMTSGRHKSVWGPRAGTQRITCLPICYLITTTTAAVTTAVAAAKVALNHWLGFIDGQSPSGEFLAIEPSGRLIGVLFGHRHKAEAFRPARITIRDDGDRFHGSIL